MYCGIGVICADARQERASGIARVSFVIAVHYGQQAADGTRPVQFVACEVYGRFGEQVQGQLKKGQAVMVTLQDPHVAERPTSGGGKRHVIEGAVVSLQFVKNAPDFNSVMLSAKKTQVQEVQQEDGFLPASAPGESTGEYWTAGF